MGILNKWLLLFLHSQLDLAAAAAKHANAEQHLLLPHSQNQLFTWPVRSPTLTLKKRGQVRKITSYKPDGPVPITMDIGDETHQIECAFAKDCIDAYNAERAASLLCPLPPITTLRGAILVLHTAHLVITRPRNSRVARTLLVIESFTFIGNHGCEPTSRAEHVDDVRSVAARLALVAAWVDPIADVSIPQSLPPEALVLQSRGKENEDMVVGMRPVVVGEGSSDARGPFRLSISIDEPESAAAKATPPAPRASLLMQKEKAQVDFSDAAGHAALCHDEWELQIVVSDED
ncbi:hypothetical protein HDU87_002687 [Geranomyces variabilis]|uniref:Uncharacterized protein n=1 Tax=Geranomyces variabilis TaxID=109894 RepID=A0AAD5XRA1_9FUNG|nr:hypothetical protein HDU87_002687 [Geranomyces variabilis]